MISVPECAETPNVQADALDFFPVPDRDGWYPIDEGQSVEEILAWSESRKDDDRKHIVERFESVVAVLQGEPDWAELPEREKTARILEAMGYHSKAERYRDCRAKAIPIDCVPCGERYFDHYLCTLRTCPSCAKFHFARLMDRYCEPIADFLHRSGRRRGYTLAGIDFTFEAENRMPHPDKLRLIKKCVKRWFKKFMPKDVEWGVLPTIEPGHELGVKHPNRKAGGWNFHVHCLYWGPYLDQPEARRFWEKITAGRGKGFRIKQRPGWRRDPLRAVREALAHHFGYILKPAAVSPERIAALEILYSGLRRVEALGVFRRLPKPPKKASRRCPKCNAPFYINLRAWHRAVRRPVGELLAEGRRDVQEVRREMVKAGRVGGHSPPWEALYK